MKLQIDIEQLKATFRFLVKATSGEVMRPGTYRGTHFYDLGTDLIWASSKDGASCGTERWFAERKKSGDTCRKIGMCMTTGMDEYEIHLA